MIDLKSRKNSGGYSLAELLVVVAMIGVISLVTVPQFMVMFRSARIKSSLRQFTGDVRAARTKAVTRHRKFRVAICNTGDGLTDGCDVSGITPPVSFPGKPVGRVNKLLRHEYLILENTTGTTWNRIPDGQPLGGVRQLEDTVFFGNITFTDVDSDGLLDITFLTDGTIETLPDAGTDVVIRTESEIPKPVISIDFNKTGQLKALD